MVFKRQSSILNWIKCHWKKVIYNHIMHCYSNRWHPQLPLWRIIFWWLCALSGSNHISNSGFTGSETGEQHWVTRKSEERHEAHRQETTRAKQTGESQISQTETAGGRSSKTAGTIRKERGDPGIHRWKEQWPEKTGGGGTDGEGWTEVGRVWIRNQKWKISS